MEDLLRVHPKSYLDEFKSFRMPKVANWDGARPFRKADMRSPPFLLGLSKAALAQVLSGSLDNAYALSRPPGHHCLPDYPNGFCLLANIAIAIEASRASAPDLRVAVLDWDVHHGNGTEAIFYEDPSVLTVSIHQERNYPMDTGDSSTAAPERVKALI